MKKKVKSKYSTVCKHYKKIQSILKIIKIINIMNYVLKILILIFGGNFMRE